MQSVPGVAVRLRAPLVTSATLFSSSSFSSFPQQQPVSRSSCTTPSTSSSFASTQIRTFFSQPRPSLTPAEISLLSQPRTRINHQNNITVGPDLIANERQVLGLAKRRDGFLTLGPHLSLSGLTLCNVYYKYCWAVQRPYIAIDSRGGLLLLDFRPMLGLGSIQERAAASLGAYAETVNTTLAAQPGGSPVQLSSDTTLTAQINRTLPGPKEGSNVNKRPLRNISAEEAKSTVFSIHVDGKYHALAVAKALYVAYTTTFSLPTPTQAMNNAAISREHMAQNERRVMLRKLRHLVADEEAVRRLRTPSGVVDGAANALRNGQVK